MRKIDHLQRSPQKKDEKEMDEHRDCSRACAELYDSCR